MVLEELTRSEKPSLVFPFPELHIYKIQYTIVNCESTFRDIKMVPNFASMYFKTLSVAAMVEFLCLKNPKFLGENTNKWAAELSNTESWQP